MQRPDRQIRLNIPLINALFPDRRIQPDPLEKIPPSFSQTQTLALNPAPLPSMRGLIGIKRETPASCACNRAP